MPVSSPKAPQFIHSIPSMSCVTLYQDRISGTNSPCWLPPPVPTLQNAIEEAMNSTAAGMSVSSFGRHSEEDALLRQLGPPLHHIHFDIHIHPLTSPYLAGGGNSSMKTARWSARLARSPAMASAARPPIPSFSHQENLGENRQNQWNRHFQG